MQTYCVHLQGNLGKALCEGQTFFDHILMKAIKDNISIIAWDADSFKGLLSSLFFLLYSLSQTSL